MTREFLEELQLPQEVAEAVLQEHERAVQDIAFRHDLDAAIGRLRGRNATAIRALLDLDALKTSEDPQAMEKALAQLKKTDGYLFAQEEAAPMFSIGAGASVELPRQQGGLAQALRERMERKD